MTTVAADVRRRVMCADGMWSNGTSVGPIRKVHRVRDELVGFAGTVAHAMRWLDAWKTDPTLTHEPRSLKGLDTLVLLLSDDGLRTWSALDGWMWVESPRWAVGSGDHAARGALAAGASCKRAVAIACGIDAGSRLPVHSYRLRGSR